MKYLISHSIVMMVLCVGGMSSALSQACAPLDTAEVLQAEQQRLSAQMKNDLDTMEQLLDDELIYIRNSAIVDSKASFLDSMRKGDTVYEFIEHSNDSVRIYDCMAILTGQGQYDVRIGQKSLKLILRYHSIWQKSKGLLRMVSWQATKVP
jgi:hypothetical protein